MPDLSDPALVAGVLTTMLSKKRARLTLSRFVQGLSIRDMLTGTILRREEYRRPASIPLRFRKSEDHRQRARSGTRGRMKKVPSP
jgi:hypothetical protein